MEGAMTRSQLLEALAQHIVHRPVSHPLRVAIDGVDAAGKTTLANDLVAPVQARGRPVIRATIDGFHNPARLRYRRGSTSPEGYYHDSFDCRAVVACLLAPLGPDGSRWFRPAVFDARADAAVPDAPRMAEADAVLLFDGVFLLRPELRGYWDVTIFVDAAFDVVLDRAQHRDRDLFGGTGEARRQYETRYIPGQRLYLATSQPRQRADLIVENNDPAQPTLYDGNSRDLPNGT
jgi:uridine kinase